MSELTRAGRLEPHFRFKPENGGETSDFKLRPVLLVAAFCAFWFINHPGRLDIDALEMFIGGALPEFRNDWHSPAIGWLWNLPAPFFGRPASALLIHSLLLAFGCAVTPVVRSWNGWTVAAAALELFWKTALIGMAGIVSKDVLLIGLLLAALAAFRLYSGRRSRVWLGACFMFLALAAVARPPNIVMLGVAAALTLPFYAGGAKRYINLLLLSGLALVGCVILSAAVNRYILHAKPSHPEVQLVIFDVAGTSFYSGTNLFEQMPGKPAGKLPDLRSCYRPELWDEFAPWGSCRAYSASVNAAAKHAGAANMVRWWLGGLVSNALAYAKHRAAYMGEALQPRFMGRLVDGRLKVSPPLNAVQRRPLLEQAARGRVPSGWFQSSREDTMPQPIAIVATMAFWFPGVVALTLAVCIALFADSIRRLRSSSMGFVTVLAASTGIGNVVMMTLFGAAASQRYFYPLIVAAYVGVTEWLRLRGLEQKSCAQA
jgi:hypothetical protein